MRNERKIANLMQEYFILLRQIKALKSEAETLKAELLDLCGKPGVYGEGRVIDFEEVQVEVSAYTRKGYRTIRYVGKDGRKRKK